MAGAAGMGPLNGSSHHAGSGSRSGAEDDRALLRDQKHRKSVIYIYVLNCLLARSLAAQCTVMRKRTCAYVISDKLTETPLCQALVKETLIWRPFTVISRHGRFRFHHHH